MKPEQFLTYKYLFPVLKTQTTCDLYFRIYVLPIQVPPLRNRRAAIPLLIGHFLEKMKNNLKKDIPHFTDKDMKLFMDCSYPGNVRELEHMVERFCLFDQGADELFSELRDLSPAKADEPMYDRFFMEKNPLKEAAKEGRSRAERELILHTLQYCNNDYAATAKKLNIGRSSFYNKIKEYGIIV